MSRDPHSRIADALPRFPALYDQLQNIRPSTPERGSFVATLAGDASGTVDAITGEGVCLAFRQSLALAEALEAGDLRRYEAEHARLSRPPVLMAGFMLTMDRSSWLRRRALGALSERPELFTNLVAAHVGRRNLAQFAATAAALGWEIATA